MPRENSHSFEENHASGPVVAFFASHVPRLYPSSQEPAKILEAVGLLLCKFAVKLGGFMNSRGTTLQRSNARVQAMDESGFGQSCPCAGRIEGDARKLTSNPARSPAVFLIRLIGVGLFCTLSSGTIRAQQMLPPSSQSPLGAQEWVRPSTQSLLGVGGEIRPSVATAQALAQRGNMFGLNALPPALDYNLKLGPITFRFGTGLQIQFNDNIKLSDANREADIIVSPLLNISGSWPITRFNSLGIQLGIGYSFYLFHPENSSPTTAFSIDPNFSSLSFNVKIGEVYLNFYDRPSLQQSAMNELTLRNPAQTLNFSRLSNVIGMSAFWDLNRISASLGINRYDVYPFQSEYQYLQQAGETINASVSGRVNELITGGLQGSLSFVQYKEQIQNDSGNLQAGPFADIVLTRFLRLSLSGGYQGAVFSSSGSNGDSSNLGSYYANITFSNNLNAYVSQTLSIGREAQLGTNSNYTEVFYINHGATWRIFNNISFSTSAFFQSGKESGGVSPQDFNQYGLLLSFGYPIGKKISSSLQYSFVRRTASGASSASEGSLDYYQNLVNLNFSYVF